MPTVVEFTAPHVVRLAETPRQPLEPGTVRIETWYSGISAGTELTAYRGTNPYLTSSWDSRQRLFVEGTPTFEYPVSGWGYSEVGQVIEAASDVADIHTGDIVYGIWGHRSEAVLAAAKVAGHVLTSDTPAILGIFARVGAIALNAVLAANVHIDEDVAIFGQGVIGLLATRIATLSGSNVIAVDALRQRLRVAEEFGARHVVDATDPAGAGAVVRGITGGGVDCAIELSGSDRALHEAVRSVAVEGTVAACGFYQGGAAHLRLGEEFHHNRVKIIASQISGVPTGLGLRWDQERLVRTAMKLICSGSIDAERLVTDLVDADLIAEVFERLDHGDENLLQAVIRYPAAPRRAQ